MFVGLARVLVVVLFVAFFVFLFFALLFGFRGEFIVDILSFLRFCVHGMYHFPCFCVCYLFGFERTLACAPRLMSFFETYVY